MNILLVDDEKDVRVTLSAFLRKLGHNVACMSNGLDGLNEFHLNDYDLIITDIRMPTLDGIEFLRHIKEIEQSDAGVIIITGHGDMDNAIKSLKYGAYDYFQKPIDIRELSSTINRYAEYEIPENKNFAAGEDLHEGPPYQTHCPKATTNTRPDSLREIGSEKMGIYSDTMRNVIDLAKKYCGSKTISVLIEGETGTGKELVARYIHYHGEGDQAKPFVAINCGALPAGLFETELFGHERGAYTGASTTGQKGKLELAHGGTIFLDEIGELPVNLQVKLLRVIEEKRFFRIGGTIQVEIDAQIICATNKNLAEEVRANRFRPDLFYRISMATIRIPPLRERRDDILPLAIRFIKQASPRNAKSFEGFTPAAQNYLVHYRWPGNIRQLENAMLNLALNGFHSKVDVDNLSFLSHIAESNSPSSSDKPILGNDEFDLPSNTLKLEELNRTIIRKALYKNYGNVTRTSQYLCISRRVLQGRLRKMGLP